MNSILDLIFPRRCIFCRSLTPSGICDVCQESLPWVAQQKPDCYAPLFYEDAVRKMLHRYKFQGYSNYAPVLAELMTMCLRDCGVHNADMVCWVPSSRRREYRRGYDQSRRLAESLAGKLKLPLTRALIKKRHNISQSKLKYSEERIKNVTGAFDARLDLSAKSIILVDDIYTTGATMRECTQILYSSGASKITCVCAAKKR